jgi:hypothetical protein
MTLELSLRIYSNLSRHYSLPFWEYHRRRFINIQFSTLCSFPRRVENTTRCCNPRHRPGDYRNYELSFTSYPRFPEKFLVTVLHDNAASCDLLAGSSCRLLALFASASRRVAYQGISQGVCRKSATLALPVLLLHRSRWVSATLLLAKR